MKAFFHHFLYEFRTGIRDRSNLLMNYLFPLGVFVLLSALMVKLNPLFPDLMLPGMTLFAILASALLNLPTTLVNAREKGVYRSFRINGVPSGSLLAIPPLGGLVHMAVVTALIALLGTSLFGGTAPSRPGGYALAALLSYAAIAGIGALIGVASGNNRASMLIGQLVYLPSILLGGLMVPLSALSGGLERISLLLPTTHAMRVFAWLGMESPRPEAPWVSLAVLITTTVLCFGLAAGVFQWDSRMSQPNRRAGLALIGALPFVLAAAIG